MNEQKNIKNWLPLIEYSNKHNISISTLRRRIKDNSIAYKLEDGKYFIVDDSVEKASRGRKPIMIQAISTPENIESKNEILAELKRAYLTALQSKEDQICLLKEEVADLKTLVKVLEADNERLRSESQFFTSVRQY
jgi:hypothetical protein